MTIANSAEAAKPLGLGEMVLDGKLTSQKGDECTLYGALAQKPTVIIFYRGSW